MHSGQGQGPQARRDYVLLTWLCAYKGEGPRPGCAYPWPGAGAADRVLRSPGLSESPFEQEATIASVSSLFQGPLGSPFPGLAAIV